MQHLIKKNPPWCLHVRPHCAGSNLLELHCLHFLFHAGKVGLLVVRRLNQQHPLYLLSSSILCSSLPSLLCYDLNPVPNVSVHCLTTYFTVFLICLFFLETKSPVPPVKRLPPPPPLPSARPSFRTDNLFPLKPPSVRPAGWGTMRAFSRATARMQP